MPTGGRLTIETGVADLDEEYARHHLGAVRGRHTLIAVSDTGVGMDEDTKAHLFEPFFSTKAPGQGTGLGLATVYGIVKQSGGHIWFYSELGHGATFKIYLPAVEGTADSAPAAEPAPSRGTETILVVEDEAAVRRLIVQLLRGLGYHVLEGIGSAGGLELGLNYPDRIHLLLTDVVMPGMSGSEIAARLLTRRTDLKVVFMSGYTDDAVVRHGVLQAGVAFLQKPFTVQALAGRVRQVLDG
jgi:CheY-like chemotaxis protein